MIINKLSNSLEKWAYNVSTNKKQYDKINNIIFPIGESLFAGSMYSYFIDKNKNIEKERKPALQYQNIICTLGGIFLSNTINKSIQKHQEGIVESLKEMNLSNGEKLINGLRIAMPIIIFTSIIRFFIPVISTPISSKITEIQKREKNKINLKG